MNELQPLAGLRVLDLGQIYQGPYAGFLLAMAGAEVVKVEPPGGEHLRSPPPEHQLPLAMLNSNKKAITLNLKSSDGVALLKRLVPRFDVLLENFAPDVMNRLGVGWKVLKQVNPALIYATASGYGISGPDYDHLAMDHTIQAVSGVMSLTGTRGGPPIRAGAQFIDILGGVHSYAGILTALQYRHRTGKGTLVETAMVESVYATITTELGALQRTGEIPQPQGSRSASTVTPYGIFAASDGHLAMISVNEHHWNAITTVIGREELRDDPRFAEPADRYRNEAEINAIIETWCGQRTRDEAVASFRAARIPVGAVRNIDEVRRDPHMHARGMLEWFHHPVLGDVVLPRSPIRFPELGPPELHFFPALGQHNREVYCDLLGIAEQDLESLQSRGVV